MSRSCSVLFVLAVAACGPRTAAEKAQADMATVRREQNPALLLDRGRGFAAVGDTTRAEEYLVAALDAGAPADEVLPTLLEVCVQTGRYRSAIQHAERHLRRHPGDARARYVLGTLYAAGGEERSARESLEEVVRTRPEDSGAHYALAVLARDASDVRAADRHFREYLRLAPGGAHAEEARASLLTPVAPVAPVGPATSGPSALPVPSVPSPAGTSREVSP